MDSVGFVDILALVLLVWVIVLTIFLYKQSNYFKQLFPKSDSRDIRNKFKEVVDILSEFGKRVDNFEGKLRSFNKEGLYHIQKLSILRYNPYNDTGGNQSFSLVMLDGRNNGLILSRMHSRAGTRVYVKTIKIGESELELSKEEKQVLKQALDNTEGK